MITSGLDSLRQQHAACGEKVFAGKRETRCVYELVRCNSSHAHGDDKAGEQPCGAHCESGE